MTYTNDENINSGRQNRQDQGIRKTGQGDADRNRNMSDTGSDVDEGVEAGHDVDPGMKNKDKEENMGKSGCGC